jgi:hypothetical protein
MVLNSTYMNCKCSVRESDTPYELPDVGVGVGVGVGVPEEFQGHEVRH